MHPPISPPRLRLSFAREDLDLEQRFAFATRYRDATHKATNIKPKWRCNPRSTDAPSSALSPRGTRLNSDHRNKVDEVILQEAYIVVAKKETGEYGRTTDEVVLGFFLRLRPPTFGPPCFIHNRLCIHSLCTLSVA